VPHCNTRLAKEQGRFWPLPADQLVLLAGDGDTIMAMMLRGAWLVACAAQAGVVASIGCSSRALDPGVPGQPVGPGVPPGQPLDAAAAAGPKVPWIAFDSDGSTVNRDIYVVRPDGTGRRRLTTAASSETEPSFSRDGTKLAFASDRDGGITQIYLMDLATGLTTRVTARAEGAHDPAFTIDGTRVGYRSGVYVFTAMLDGTDERTVTDGKSCCAGATFGGPAFAGDGQSTIYDDYNAIYATSDGTARRTIVMPTTGEQSHPALSPDGASVVLQATCLDDNAARSLWTVPATGTTDLSCTGGRRISARGTDATHASWGPDGTIVWGSVAGGNNSSSPVPSALVAWLDGTLWTVINDGADDRNPSWSPAGTIIGDW